MISEQSYNEFSFRLNALSQEVKLESTLDAQFESKQEQTDSEIEMELRALLKQIEMQTQCYIPTEQVETVSHRL